MIKWMTRLVLLAVVAGLGYWLWTVFFPSNETVIRQRLHALAQAASFKANEAPLAKLSKTQELGAFVLPDVTITIDIPGREVMTINGKEQLLEVAGGARFVVQGLSVEFLDINIAVAPDKQSASAELTVKAQIAGEKDLVVQELKFAFRKTEGAWLIQNVETLRTLKLN
jgi:hypothetical protein